jgi:AcrR family transcriptional regulator
VASLVPRSANSEKRATVEAAVLGATEALLAEGRPFTDLRVEEIATRAGLSRTAFYFYFRGKRELLVRLAEGVTELLWSESDTWWSGAGDADALREALRRVTAVWAAHGVMLRAVIEASAYDEVVAQFWRGIMDGFVEATRARIEADGVPVPAESTAQALCWMTERTYYQWVAQGGEFDDPRLTEGVAAVWTRAIYGS